MRLRILLVSALLAYGTAGAGEVARAVSPTSAIVLYNDKGECREGSTEAIYLDRNQQVRGCWFERFDRIWLYFDDNDTLGIDKKAFKFQNV